MSRRLIYTRAYSDSSAGKLVSAKGPDGDPLTEEELLDEFRHHTNIYNREPTALISFSDRIIDTVKRAYDKHYIDGESPEDIWVAFIEVPATMHEKPGGLHSARRLATLCGCPWLESTKFKHEFVFEWGIPKEYVVHQVLLKTLKNRGLGRKEIHLLPPGRRIKYLTTLELRASIAAELQPHDARFSPEDHAWDRGLVLASFAQCFGARSPLNWAARQLFHDCIQISDPGQRFTYATGYSAIAGPDFFPLLDLGIEDGLMDFWLLTDEHVFMCREFEEWKEPLVDYMAFDTLRARREGQDEMQWAELRVRHEQIKPDIEEKYVAIGR